jgi:hypothetical protein
VAAAFAAVARRVRVFAAFSPAARCFRVATAFLAAARRLRVRAAFAAAAPRFAAFRLRVAVAFFPALLLFLGLISSSVAIRNGLDLKLFVYARPAFGLRLLLMNGDTCLRLFGGNTRGENHGSRYPRRENAENTNRAAYLHGKPVVRRMAFYDWVPTPKFLEGCSCDCVVAVLPWCELQLAGALTSRSGR